MSLLVAEHSMVVDRLSLISSNAGSLKQLNESIGFELTTLVGQDQLLDLRAASLAQGPVRSWTSFTLGLRGKTPLRISLMGSCLEERSHLFELSEISEATIFHIPASLPESDLALSLKIPPHLQDKPAVFLDFFSNSSDLRSRALVEWSQRNFKRSLYLKADPGFFAKALEWVLSF